MEDSDLAEILDQLTESVRALGGHDDERRRGLEPRHGTWQTGQPVVTGSRYVAPSGANKSLVDHVASGGDLNEVEHPGEFKASRFGRTSGRRAESLWVKALSEATTSAGGALVPIELSDQVVSLIRARSAVMTLGPTVVPVQKELDVASLATGAVAYYVAENAAITPSEETFGLTALLRPKELAALVPVSNRLLRDASNPSVDSVITNDLAEVMMLKQDYAFIQGTGGTSPTGITQASGIQVGPNLGANGALLTFDNLKDIVGGQRLLNSGFSKPGWIMSPRTLTSLGKIKITSGGQPSGQYLGDTGLLTHDGAGTGGTLLGYPYRTTSQIPINLTVGTSTDCTFLIFGSDWSEFWVGENQTLMIEMSGDANYTPDGGTSWVSAFQNRMTLFRAVMAHDCALRRASFFTVTTGVRS